MAIYTGDIRILKSRLKALPRFWDGKSCVLELKDADYNWRQMEWFGFYFEYKVRQALLPSKMQVPGDTFGNVTFDVKGKINWDMKAKAIKSDSHVVILNDVEAMEKSVDLHGYHGEIIALCDVHYNDFDRSFQKWHSELKGGLSQYELNRISRTATSRYRKTDAVLTQILLVIFDSDDLELLSIMKQGRNSNGKSRKEKYALNIENIEKFKYYLMEV